MRACTSAFTLGVILWRDSLVLSPQGTSIARVGSWQLNVAKSKYTPGPAPKSQILKIEAAGKGEKVTSETVSAAGDKSVTEYTADYDGKPHPLKGSAVADMVTLKRVDSHTTERIDSRNRQDDDDLPPLCLQGRQDDDRHDQRHNAQGQATSNVVVFEKQ